MRILIHSCKYNPAICPVFPVEVTVQHEDKGWLGISPEELARVGFGPPLNGHHPIVDLGWAFNKTDCEVLDEDL